MLYIVRTALTLIQYFYLSTSLFQSWCYSVSVLRQRAFQPTTRTWSYCFLCLSSSSGSWLSATGSFKLYQWTCLVTMVRTTTHVPIYDLVRVIYTCTSNAIIHIRIYHTWKHLTAVVFGAVCANNSFVGLKNF